MILPGLPDSPPGSHPPPAIRLGAVLRISTDAIKNMDKNFKDFPNILFTSN